MSTADVIAMILGVCTGLVVFGAATLVLTRNVPVYPQVRTFAACCMCFGVGLGGVLGLGALGVLYANAITGGTP